MGKLTAQTEVTSFLDTDMFYGVIDPGGSPLSRKLASLTIQRYLPMSMDVVSGLGMQNGTDANNDIDIASGRAVDGGGTYNLILPATITKQLDASWAVGSNHGGLDAGGKAISTWYHVWLIARVDTHVIDVLYSLSATAPTMPANYTKKRRIGAIRTDSSGNIIGFLQYGDNFLWKSPPFLDINDATLTTAKKNYALSGVPTGVVVLARLNIGIGAGSAQQVYISNPNLTDLAPSLTAAPLVSIWSTIATASPIIEEFYTDTSAQISARSTGASTTIKATAIGWRDPRGKY